MSPQYTTELVGSLVEQQRSRAEVLRQFGIDYVFEGNSSLAEVCLTAGAELRTVCDDLEECDATHTLRERKDWFRARLTELVDHIIKFHHSYLREELPWLESLLDRVVHQHGEKHPELRDVREVLSDVQYKMHAHMIKEEQTVFSMIRRLEQSHNTGRKPPNFGSTSMRDAIHELETEHHTAVDALERIRELTCGFSRPPDACDLYRALLVGLEDLEADLRLHLHEENNILFPRAIELDNQLRSDAA